MCNIEREYSDTCQLVSLFSMTYAICRIVGSWELQFEPPELERHLFGKNESQTMAKHIYFLGACFFFHFKMFG